MQDEQATQKPPAFPKPPKSALFSKLEAFLPMMAEENKKLSEAVAAGQGAKHNIEVAEQSDEDDEDEEDDAMTGDDEKPSKPRVIKMDFALGMMDEDDSHSDTEGSLTAADPATQIKAALGGYEKESDADKSASSFRLQLEKPSGKPRPVIQELN